MLDGSESTAAETRDTIISIRNLIEQTLETGKKKLPSKVYSKELIELLFHQPYTKTQTLVNAGLAERTTAVLYLRELERAGVLRSKKSGKEVLFLNVKLFQLLSK
jgi:Fic family protein